MKHNFQSKSKKSGDVFEEQVKQFLEKNGYQNIRKSQYLKKLGIEMDYIAFHQKVEYYIECKGGESSSSRPGAQRTDNVKKAICNGALLKVRHPDAFFVVYFSKPPKENSDSDIMLQVALEGNIINEVRYLEYDDEPTPPLPFLDEK